MFKIGKYQPRMKFTPEEDKKLVELVLIYGFDDWQRISQLLPGRCPRQCKDRYFHYLSPHLAHDDWNAEMDQRLSNYVAQYGRKWKAFEAYFPGRTSVFLKNRYNKILRRKRRTEQCCIKDDEFRTTEASCDLDALFNDINLDCESQCDASLFDLSSLEIPVEF